MQQNRRLPSSTTVAVALPGGSWPATARHLWDVIGRNSRDHSFGRGQQTSQNRVRPHSTGMCERRVRSGFPQVCYTQTRESVASATCGISSWFTWVPQCLSLHFCINFFVVASSKVSHPILSTNDLFILGGHSYGVLW